MAGPYVGDVAFAIDLDCGESIAGATDRHIYVLQPDGVILDWAASISGTEVLRYVTTSSSDLSQTGTHIAQGKITHNGATLRTSSARFVVSAPFT